MGKCYDNWGRLVEAVMRREQLRALSLAESRSPSIRSLDSDYSFSSSSWRDSLSFSPSPLHPDVERFRLDGKQTGKNKPKNAVWKRLLFFGGFSSKKEDEREAEWRRAQTTLHGLVMKESGSTSSLKFKAVSQNSDEIARVRELYTLKGHIESLAKKRGVDLDSIPQHYSI